MNIELTLPKRFRLEMTVLVVAALIGLGIAGFIGSIWFAPEMMTWTLLAALVVIFVWVIPFIIIARRWEMGLRVGVFALFLLYSLFAMTIYAMTNNTLKKCVVREVISDTQQLYYCQYGPSEGGEFIGGVPMFILTPLD